MTRQFVASDGTPLFYERRGPDTGAAIVLCHGLGAGSAQFAEDAAWLSRAGYSVLTPDLRGHGRSGLPDQLSPKGFAPDRLAADMVEMLDHAGVDRAHWVGNSLGGIIGLNLAQSSPQRLRTLTLFGTALALNLPPLSWLVSGLDIIPGRKLTARLTAWSTTTHRPARPLIETMLNAYDGRAAAMIVEQIRRYDLTEAARLWAGPGLVLVGGRDHAVNRALLGQLAQLDGRPNWQVHHLPEGGHCANLDAGAAWRNAITQFWDRARPPPP